MLGSPKQAIRPYDENVFAFSLKLGPDLRIISKINTLGCLCKEC